MGGALIVECFAPNKFIAPLIAAGTVFGKQKVRRPAPTICRRLQSKGRATRNSFVLPRWLRDG